MEIFKFLSGAKTYNSYHKFLTFKKIKGCVKLRLRLKFTFDALKSLCYNTFQWNLIKERADSGDQREPTNI